MVNNGGKKQFADFNLKVEVLQGSSGQFIRLIPQKKKPYHKGKGGIRIY
jgi:hypothetical protein